jgi:putative methyltransferase (TIGR04325 family)
MRTLYQFLAPVIQRLRVGAEFTGNYPSWSAATAAVEGYDAPQILEAVHASALKVKRGEAEFERDSVCFDYEEFRWPLLSCLLQAALQNRGSLHVADFGGSLGSFYFQHRKFLSDIQELKWSVIEQSEYVRVGRQDFEDETLKFFHTFDEATKMSKIDVTLFSGSLQYVENPFDYIRQAAALSQRIMIDRTPFIQDDRDRITVQCVPASIYEGSYPHRFFSTTQFAAFMRGLGYSVFTEWAGFDKGIVKSRYLGRAYHPSDRGSAAAQHTRAEDLLIYPER